MNSIGRYRLERRIGAGSFATVWLGHDPDLDVAVAVKVLAENWADNADVRNRFLTEARILRKIRDRRLVQVYDIGTLEDGRPYFVMDYIDGGSMNDLRVSGVEPVRALRLSAEACRALEVLHENDIIHRDVTPGNLLLSHTDDGETRVLIADLGVAKSTVDAVGATLTAGTPSYMAPEQATGGLPLDRRADVYSLTAVAYALLTGDPPFPVRSIADIVARDPAAAPPPVAARVGAPPSLDSVMVSGLASDRNRRPPTALLLAQGFETIADQMTAARNRDRPSPPAAPPPPPAERTLVTNPMPANRPPDPVPPPPSMSTPPPAYSPAAYVAPRPVVSQPAPYATGRISAVEQPTTAPRRGFAYYLLLGLVALAVFAISMFITILVLR